MLATVAAQLQARQMPRGLASDVLHDLQHMVKRSAHDDLLKSL
jgi:hypothetical protein